MNTSVGAGILALGDSHGGAIEGCMKMLQSEKSPEQIIDQSLEKGKNIPGLGHKVYEDKDPRAQKILEKAENLGMSGQNIQKMLDIQEAFTEKKGQASC